MVVVVVVVADAALDSALDDSALARAGPAPYSIMRPELRTRHLLQMVICQSHLQLNVQVYRRDRRPQSQQPKG